ncbi:MAG: winged helix-turn-helix domain-containing protein, partial [Myxococcota bacterium]
TDRQKSVLRVRGAYAEERIDADVIERERVAKEMAAALFEMAEWLGVDDVVVDDKGNLALALRKNCR